MSVGKVQACENGDEEEVGSYSDGFGGVAVYRPAEERTEEEVEDSQGKKEESGSKGGEAVGFRGERGDCSIKGAEKEGLNKG